MSTEAVTEEYDYDDADDMLAAARRDFAYGFRWDQVVVTRISAVQRGPGPTYKCLRIEGDDGAAIDVYVSPHGRRIRVFSRGEEWGPPRP